MIFFEIYQLFMKKRWHWLSIFSVLFVLSFIVQHNFKIPPLNILDHIIMNLSQQYICMLIIPILFLTLITDMVVGDINDRTITLILVRNKSRISWLLSKVIILVFTSILFTIGCIFIYFSSAIIQGLPFEFRWSNNSLFEDTNSPFKILMMISVDYVYSLTAFGLFILMVSFLVHYNPLIGIIIGFLFSLFSYISWTLSVLRPFLKWTPTGQMMFLAQYPNRYTENLPGFTTMWSFSYNFTLFILSLLIFMCLVRIKNISRVN